MSWNMVFQIINRFHIFSHHGGVANVCRWLLRGCFPLYPKIKNFLPLLFSPLSRPTMIIIPPVWKRTTQQKMNELNSELNGLCATRWPGRDCGRAIDVIEYGTVSFGRGWVLVIRAVMSPLFSVFDTFMLRGLTLFVKTEMSYSLTRLT